MATKIKAPKWDVKKDGNSYFLDGPFTDGLKYQDRRGDAIGQRVALTAAFNAGVEAGLASAVQQTAAALTSTKSEA